MSKTPIDALAERYAAGLAELNPVAATEIGLPGYAEKMPDYSQDAADALDDLQAQTLRELGRLQAQNAQDEVTRNAMVERLTVDRISGLGEACAQLERAFAAFSSWAHQEEGRDAAHEAALEALEADHDFLLAGDVFDRDQIQGYLSLKWTEVYAFEQSPHPIEFQMYYSS